MTSNQNFLEQTAIAVMVEQGLITPEMAQEMVTLDTYSQWKAKQPDSGTKKQTETEKHDA